MSRTPEGGHGRAKDTDIVMLAPVSVHADYLRQGIGSAMIKLGIEKVKEKGFKGITGDTLPMICTITLDININLQREK